MKGFYLALISVFLLGGTATSAGAQAREKNSPLLRRQLSELNGSFTYRGKAIHPRAIQDLVAWTADPRPGPVAVDVAGSFDSDRYFGEYETRKDKSVFINLAQKILEREGWFAYRHLGRLANGYHVLRTYENGGGTGIFGNLLLVECLIDFEYGEGGTRRQFLVLKRRGQFNLGDKYAGKIRLLPEKNTILIGADDNSDGRPPGDLVKASRIRIQ